MRARRRLVLFDIDGTLLDCGGSTRSPLAQALEETYGTCGTLWRDGFAGKTDDQIVFESLLAAGFEEREISEGLAVAKQRYVARIREVLSLEKVRLLPGAVETLARMAENPGVECGLLTGNWRHGADCKLGVAGIADHFAFGVYGDDCRARAELAPRALAAAAECFGHHFEPADALIVGDTVNDVACGRAGGIAVVGLATGAASSGELRAAGASAVYSDLVEARHLESLLDQTWDGSRWRSV